MNFGYARVFEEEQEQNPMRDRMLQLVDRDNFLFQDIRNKAYERQNYMVLRNLLNPGDMLYIDSLDSLGRTWEEMAAEWQALTTELQVDVVILDAPVQIDSQWFLKMGEVGQMLEQQMLALLVYIAELQRRRVKENQRDGIDAALKAGKKFGRPPLQWDWVLFDATAQRWADREISLEEACEIMDSARSSWYKYVKERGFVRKRKKKIKAE